MEGFKVEKVKGREGFSNMEGLKVGKGSQTWKV